MSVIDIAKDISEGLARNACAGEIDGKVVDLRTVVSEDCNLNILTFNDEAGKRHTGIQPPMCLQRLLRDFILMQSLQSDHPLTKAFIIDFDCPAFDRAALDNLEAEMKKIIKKEHPLKDLNSQEKKQLSSWKTEENHIRLNLLMIFRKMP